MLNDVFDSPLFVLGDIFFFEADFVVVFFLDFEEETVVMGSTILGVEEPVSRGLVTESSLIA